MDRNINGNQNGNFLTKYISYILNYKFLLIISILTISIVITTFNRILDQQINTSQQLPRQKIEINDNINIIDRDNDVWKRVYGVANESCPRFIVTNPNRAGFGDMLSRLSGGLAVALATKSTLVLLKRFWEGLTDHASQGYDVRVFEDLGIPIRKFLLQSEINSKYNLTINHKILYVDQAVLGHESVRDMLPCYGMIVLGDGYGCAESIPNRDSWCLLSFGPQIQSIIQPLLDESVNIQKKMNPIKKYNYPLRADRLNVVWHVRTGDICLHCRDTTLVYNVDKFIDTTLQFSNLVTFRQNIVIFMPEKLIHELFSNMSNVIYADNLNERQVIRTFLEADILITLGSSFPNIISWFTPLFEPIVFEALEKNSDPTIRHLNDSQIHNIYRYYIMEGRAIRLDPFGKVIDYEPTDINFMLKHLGITNRIHKLVYNNQCYHFMNNTYIPLSHWIDKQKILDCSMLHGNWVKDSNNHVINDHKCSDYHNNTIVYYTERNCSNIVANFKYNWKSNTCFPDNLNQYDLNPHELCEFMNGKGILIVGDPIQGQFAISLINSITKHMNKRCLSCGHQCNDTITIECPSPYKNYNIYNIRNDRLSLIKRQSLDYSTNFMENPWLWPLDSDPNGIGLAILNRGTHYEVDSAVMDTLTNVFSYLYKHYPQVTVIYRSTPVGHINFEEKFHSEPLDKPITIGTHFHWDNYHRQNGLIKSHIQSNYPSYIYWDVSYLTELRIDSHFDSFHYCMPGPIDSWTIIFFNIMILYFKKGYSHKTELSCINSNL